MQLVGSYILKRNVSFTLKIKSTTNAMKWLKAMLGGHSVIFDDRLSIPQHIVICQIFFRIYEPKKGYAENRA